MKTPGRSRRLFWWFTFSFQVSDKQPDKRNHRSRGGNVFILKIFLICRYKKWKSGVEKAPGRSRRLFRRVTFRFGRRINSQINVTTGPESVGIAGQPFRIQRDGMLMAGIQFTAGEHEFQLFHQQWKSLVQMVCIRMKTPGRSRRLFWWFTFSFQVSDKQPDKRNHRSRGCRLHRSAPSHTVSRYADGGDSVHRW